MGVSFWVENTIYRYTEFHIGGDVWSFCLAWVQPAKSLKREAPENDAENMIELPSQEHVSTVYFRVNYNDLTATSLEILVYLREIIPNGFNSAG